MLAAPLIFDRSISRYIEFFSNSHFLPRVKLCVRLGSQPAIVVAMIGDSALIKVRKARQADVDSLALVFSESSHHAYTGIIPLLHLDRMVRRRDKAWWRAAVRTEKAEGYLIVLEHAGTVVGYATCGAARNGRHDSGEIYEIYLLPVYQGIGLGERLFEACRHHLDLRGLARLVVWALEDNVTARVFYWSRGGRPSAKTKERFGETELSKIAFSWS